jgi:hypothetical protein
MGPLQLWIEVARGILEDHGFEQYPSSWLMLHMEQGALGSALANRFKTTELATDNRNYRSGP